MLTKFSFSAAILSILVAISCEKKVIDVRYGPVLFDLVAPDSLEKGSPDSSYLAVNAFDPDGLDDIDSVYYMVTRPDSTSNGIRFLLHDDGVNGDSTANDGCYTYIIPSPLPTSQSGDYTFIFYAYDKQENRSNTPSQIITAY